MKTRILIAGIATAVMLSAPVRAQPAPTEAVGITPANNPALNPNASTPSPAMTGAQPNQTNGTPTGAMQTGGGSATGGNSGGSKMGGGG